MTDTYFLCDGPHTASTASLQHQSTEIFERHAARPRFISKTMVDAPSKSCCLTCKPSVSCPSRGVNPAPVNVSGESRAGNGFVVVDGSTAEGELRPIITRFRAY